MFLLFLTWFDCFWLSTPPKSVSPFHLYGVFWGLVSRTWEIVNQRLYFFQKMLYIYHAGTVVSLPCSFIRRYYHQTWWGCTFCRVKMMSHVRIHDMRMFLKITEASKSSVPFNKLHGWCMQLKLALLAEGNSIKKQSELGNLISQVVVDSGFITHPFFYVWHGVPLKDDYCTARCPQSKMKLFTVPIQRVFTTKLQPGCHIWWRDGSSACILSSKGEDI